MQIPGYTIIRELGRGGMATVYLARQDRLGRQVALKVMQPQATMAEDFASRFLKEGQIIAQLQHPQIVTIYDFNIVDDTHYFSMEYLPNGTLSDLITSGLPTSRAIEITRSIAEALSVAHDQGVIHRDIKPQNILFRTDGAPVLTDFGIARAAGASADVTQLTSIGMVIGSPRYMSPEQSKSEPIDARSDLYSLGVVLYEMLTQQLPYRAADVISLAMKHCTAPIPVLPEQLRTYQPLIERLLAKRPEDRFGSAQHLIRALDGVASGTGIAPTPEDQATRVVGQGDSGQYRTAPQPPGPQNGKKWPVAVALLLSAAVALGVYFLVIAPPPGPDIGPATSETPPDPKRAPMTLRYEALALEHLKNGQLRQGLEIVELALGSDPEDAGLKALKAQISNGIAADELRSQAQERLDQGALDDSLALIAQGLERVPDHAGLMALRAQVQQAQVELEAAQVAQLLEQAQAALARGALDEAMALVEEGIALRPGDAGLEAVEGEIRARLQQQQALQDTLARARALVEGGQLTEGLALVEQALASAPGSAELSGLKETITTAMAREAERKAAELADKARGLAQQGDLAAAAQAINQALQLQPEDPALAELRAEIGVKQRQAQAAALLGQARAAFAEGRSTEALRSVQQGLAILPDHPDLRALRTEIQTRIATQQAVAQTLEQARALLQQGQLGEGLGLIDAALQGAPEQPDLLNLRDEILTAQRQREEAQAQRQAQIEAALAQARTALTAGRLGEAGKAVDEGLGIAPDQPELKALRSEIQAQLATQALVAKASEQARGLLHEQRFSEGLEVIDGALESAPDQPDLLSLRNEILTAQREHGEAQAQRQAKIDTLLAQARTALAERRLSDAFQAAEEGLAIATDHAGLAELLAEIQAQLATQEVVVTASEQARALLGELRFAEGLEAIHKALQQAPDHPDLLGLRDEILAAQQRQQEEQAQQQARELLAEAARILEAGDLAAGLGLVEKGLQLAPELPELVQLRQRILERQAAQAEIAQRLEGCAAKRVSDKELPAPAAVTALTAAAQCYRELLEQPEAKEPAGTALTAIGNQLNEAFAAAMEARDFAAAEVVLAALEGSYPDDPRHAEMRKTLSGAVPPLPEMIAIQGGCFQMGSPETELHHDGDEGAHRICVEAFQLAKHETRVEDFQRFIEASGYETDAEYGSGGAKGCWALDLDKGDDAWGYQDWANWRSPNKYRDNQPKDPVTCVSKNDAEAYIAWLSKSSGRGFRLPTEAEWEYAARAATTTTRFWDDRVAKNACKNANSADAGQDWGDGFPCDDGHEWIAPTGGFRANPWGLHDVLGNALEWTCSEYDEGYGGAETSCAAKDSTAPVVLRGGAWNSGPAAVRSAYRNRNYPESRYSFAGFRLARDAAKKK